MNKLIVLLAVCAAIVIAVAAAFLLINNSNSGENTEEIKDPSLVELKAGDYIEYIGKDEYKVTVTESLGRGMYKVRLHASYAGEGSSAPTNDDREMTLNRLQFIAFMYPGGSYFTPNNVDPKGYQGTANVDANGGSMECKVYKNPDGYCYFIGDYGIIYGGGHSSAAPENILKTSLMDGSKRTLAKDPFSKELKAGDYIASMEHKATYNGDGKFTVNYGNNLINVWSKVDFLAMLSCPDFYSGTSVCKPAGEKSTVIFDEKQIVCDRYVGDYLSYYVGDYGILYKVSHEMGRSAILDTNIDILGY